MAHAISSLAESEKIRRLFHGSQNWYEFHCHVSLECLHPGFISITPKESRHIYALFSAINRHGVEPA